MKFLRFLLLGTGILAVLLAIAAGLALTSSVQTWAARRVIAGDPSLGITHIGRVSAGFQRIEVLDLTLERDGIAATVPSVTIELPLVAAARGNIQVRSLVATGWTLDLAAAGAGTQTPPKTEADTAAETFEGIFKQLRLPVDLAVESAELEGHVIFPTASGEASGRAHIVVKGGQLGAGREGRFTVKADAGLPGSLKLVSRIESTTTLLLGMDTPRTFSRVSASSETFASGPGFPGGARLFVRGSASRENDREAYQVVMRSVREAGEKNLVNIAASNPSATAPITGTWSFDLSDRELAPFTLGRTLPPFSLSAAGTFTTDRRFQEITASGKSDLTAEQLDSVYQGLSEWGRLRVLADFDVVHRSAGIRVNRLAADVAGASPILSVQVLQALEIVPATGEIKVAEPDTDLVKIALKGVPLAWARPFAPEVLEVTGDDLRGELIARAHQGGFAVRTVSPFILSNVNIAQAGVPLVKALTLTTGATANYTPAGWQAGVSDFRAQSGGATLLTLSARAGQAAGGGDQPVKVTGHFRADLPLLLRQPAAAEFALISSGVAEADFTGSVAASLQQFSAKLALTELRTSSGEELPSVTTDGRVDKHSNGQIDAHLPLTFARADRESDLEITANLKPAGERWEIDAQVISQKLFVDDLKAFAALQPAPAPDGMEQPPTPAPEPGEPVPDAKPVWDGVIGDVKLALKKVVYAEGQPPVELTTAIKITPELLTLESFNAAFADGAAARAEGVLKFESAAAEPYEVDASVTATNFDPQPFLAAANPGKPPTIEGKFDLAGKFFGRTPSLDQLADRAALDAQMVSRGGRFHGFETSALAANLGKGQETVSKLASAVSLLGSALGKSEVARDAEKFRAAADSVRRLVDFNFDQLNIDIAHRPGEATTAIKNFSLISPDLRLLGAGTVENAAGVSFLKRALNLDLQMAVRGAQAEDLRLLNLLKKEADALGYTALSENFPIKGTLGSMVADPLIRLIKRELSP